LIRAARDVLRKTEHEKATLLAEATRLRQLAQRNGDETDVVSQQAADLSVRNNELTSQLAVLEGQVDQLRQSVMTLTRQRDAFEVSAESLRADLETARGQVAKSREEMLRRLQVDSEARLSEFKNRLASEIDSLVNQVPSLSAEASLDVLRVIHARLFEVLKTLSAAGVPLHGAERR
jgi:chromosome segregation ATPase